MVGATGIEPVAPAMSRQCSPAELRAHPPEKIRVYPASGQAWGRDSARRAGFYMAMDVPVAASITSPDPVVVLRPARRQFPWCLPRRIRDASYPDELLAAARLDALEPAAQRGRFRRRAVRRGAGARRARCSPPPSRAPSATPIAKPWELDPGDVRRPAAALGQHHQRPGRRRARHDRPRCRLGRDDLPRQTPLRRGRAARPRPAGSRSTMLWPS